MSPIQEEVIIVSAKEAVVINELARCLEQLWSGGHGDYGVYTVANERNKLKLALASFLRLCRDMQENEN